MNEVLVTAGVVALLAAVVGGGLKAFNVEVPIVDSLARQLMLAALGAVFLVAAVVLREDDGGTAETGLATYERRVATACRAISRSSSQATFGVPGPDNTFDKRRVVGALRAGIDSGDRRLRRLLDPVAPGSLREEHAAAERAGRQYVSALRSAVRRLEATLPDRPTIEQLAEADARERRVPRARERLEDALTSLAGGRDCTLAGQAQT
jgi:hypothetical protein